MKKGLLQTLAIAILALIANLAVAQTYTFPVKGSQGFSMTHKTRDGARINYELGQFSLSQIQYRGEEMSEISIKAISIPNDEGLPNLPVESRMIAIPQGATATLNVVRAETQTFQNVNIAPALRIQAENEDPEMNYEKDMKVYSKNALYPENPFTIGESYIRGVNTVTVSITPFQYNPVTKELVVYTDVELSLSYEGGNGHFGEDRLRSPYWDPILAAELANYDQLPAIDYEARMQDWIRNNRDGAEYIIITPNNDEWAPYAQQLKEFRMKQGIITEVYRLDEIPATSTTQLKTWIHDAYASWEIAPVAICLFGDHNTNMAQGIPGETTSHPYSGTCITDNFYADAQGNDNLPDMVFSRLVAQNASELPIFVSKQIDYETTPNTDASFYTSPITALGWQTERWFQLCSEVFGGYMRAHGYTPQRINCIYSGTPGAIWSEAQNTDQVTSYFGPLGTNYIPASPADMGGWTGGTPDQVVQAVNNGTFWVQHRDHGLDEGWGEPAVRNHHIDQLNNVGKLPFVMSINCETGMFNYTGDNGNCFTEKWMRRTSNGQNAGAVGVLSPTEVSYSFVNDAFVWGVYDQFQPDFMPTLPSNTNFPGYNNRGNWRPAFGNVAGKYFLSQTAWPYNTDDKDITYTMFTAHCDAFLRIYTQVPQTMTVNHQSVQLAGLTTFQITAPEGTTIALTKGEGNNLEVVAVAEGTGSVQNMTIPSQVPPTVLHLTVTGQDYLRYEADIDVIPADGPYIIINQYELDNDASQLNFGEDAGFNLQLKNVGNTTAPGGSMTLTTESEYVTITDGTADFTDINSNMTLDLNEAFSFTISDEVPNKTSIEFVINITSGDDVYENHITMKAYAPVFEIGNVSIVEIEGNGNGRLDPGELATLRFPVQNKGNADSQATEITLEMNNAFLQIIGDATITINSIAANGSATANFEVFVGGAPSGFAAEYTLTSTSGVYTDTRDFMSKIGLNVEDFELGSIDPSLWQNDGAYPWTICNNEPYEGQYCVKSGTIGNSQETSLILTFEVGVADSIAFYYKVSSESGYDKMYFYIDNQEKNNWSGNVAWNRAQYFVTAGQHTFKWKYKKDTSVSSGEDCCWIDFVILPRDVSLTVSAGLDMDVCEGSSALINGYAANQTSLEWTTAGDGTFDDATAMTPTYTPGEQDLANGSVVLTLTAHKGNQTLSDDMTLSFAQNVVIEAALGGIHYCPVQEPQTVAVQVVSGQYDSFIWTTLGSGDFADPNELETTYTPSAEDIAAGSVTLLATATSVACGPVTYEYNIVWSPMPQIILSADAVDICEGDDAIMTFNLEGYLEMNPNETDFVLVVDGVEYPLAHDATSLDLGTPETSSTVYQINSISNGTCETIYAEGELTFTANVTPKVAVPEISGDNDLDAYVTNVSTYTVTNDVMVGFTFEPAEAGTMVVANDGKTAEITWNQTFKGNASLTATPTEECNNGASTMDIVVRNSYGVNEVANSSKLYPNPTTGKVNIECEGMTHVSVFNAVGQLVYDTDIDTDKLSVDMTQFPTGSYLVRIVTDKGVSTKHLNVIR
ncbi:MAG: T9SS type A sorting domain-containing protein [Bacteroidales bacterium]|nr:T9SS type A sorting domain-containing protein [Bacteroidales bacterium]